MLKELDDSNWGNAFGEDCISIDPEAVINAKGIRLDGINREAVAEIVAMAEGEHDADNWTGVFRLNDGRYISVSSGCDYTGWGCQAGGEIFVAHDLGSIVRFGLSEGERGRLSLTVES